MDKQIDKEPRIAQTLMDDFLSRTGINDASGNPGQRYLWTDAFAVQSCFALSHEPGREKYRFYALKIIDLVHHTLGKYRDDDLRKGWISGLSPDEGEKHPTAGGLRIGKKLPEREEGEPLNQSLEWERDGQYFHYLTRWFNSLLQAHRETGEKIYARWAAELIKAGEKFIIKDSGMLKMCWKMNTDLTWPAVKSTGEHDPVEGLVCVVSAMETIPELSSSLESLKKDLELLCNDKNWFTTDALGIGGLLLNTARTYLISLNKKPLPPSIRPGYLFSDGIAGLEAFSKQVYDNLKPLNTRLSFRECGLTLGVRVLYSLREKKDNPDIDFNELEKFLYLVKDIEDFWSNPASRQSQTWVSHADINAVTLASSLLARNNPQVYYMYKIL